MDDMRLGRTFRAARIERNQRQIDVAAGARVPRRVVVTAESGNLDDLRLRDLRALASELRIRLVIQPSFRGGDLERLVNARHNAMHERIAGLLAGLTGWIGAAEVTFFRFGERGSIDSLAWHERSRSLLVIELKTELVDPAGLIAQVDRYRRVATGVAAERGWSPATVSSWVVVADTDMNRRAVARHAALLRGAFPLGGRAMGTWLRNPAGSVSGLTFLANVRPGNIIGKFGPTRRVRHASSGEEAPSRLATVHRGER